VLIRAVKADDVSYQQTNGPGKLCRHFNISKSLNRIRVTDDKLWLEDRGIVVPRQQVKKLPRVGVDYAGVYKDKPWRFVWKLYI
jgi:DNA-3-methyladenine glycosylase